MKKYERLVRQTIADAGAAVLERIPTRNGHQRLLIRLPSGAEHKITCASSPTTQEHSIHAIKRDVERLISLDQPPERQP